MKRIKLITLILIIAFAGLKLSAQVNTMYYMTGVPQSYYLNPATQPGCDLFIGLPIVSSEYLNLYNSTLNFNDIIWTNSSTGELIQPLHPDANIDDFINKFEDENFIRGDWSAILLSFGFRVQR